MAIEKISPENAEALKTQKEKASDVVYTLNHAMVCTITDFVSDPFISHFVQKRLGSNSQLENCWKAEIIGDFGAIPFTIGVQRLFPSVMNKISNSLEPIFHDTFKKSAQKEGEKWALRHGYDPNSKKCQDRVEQIYKYEITHLPQAFMWTGFSVILNICAQKSLGSTAPISHIFAGKIGGAALTAGIAIGGRSLFPYKAEKWDKFIGEKILLPVEDKIEKIIGIENSNKTDWKNRINNNGKNEQTRGL